MPDTNSSGSGGTALQTNGIGQHCDAHLNLTRSLADIAAGPDGAMARAKARAAARTAELVEPTKIPYAGIER